MFRVKFPATMILVMLCAATSATAQRDSRTQFGTRSLQAAKHIGAAIELSRQKKNPEALKQIEAAVSADSKCQMAHYWHATIQADLGRLDESKTSFRKVYDLGSGRNGNLTVDAAVNLGLLLGKLGKYDESSVWFTRAIVADPEDKHGFRWKAFRNISVNFARQGKTTAAALAVLFAYEANPRRVSDKMVRDFLNRVGKEEAARILLLEYKIPKLTPRIPVKAQELSAVEVKQDELTDQIRSLQADPQGRYVVGIVSGAPHYYLIRTGTGVTVRKIKTKSNIRCANLVQGDLYLVLSDPVRLEKANPLTGRTSASFSLGSMTPSTIAVVPSRQMAFFPHKKEVHALNMRIGKIFSTDVPGQHVASHPSQKFVFSFVKPDIRHPGPVIINGRPVFIRTARPTWSQSTLFKSLVTRSGLQLSAVRDNAGANAYRVVVSDNGQWVALPGGGGWRPTDNKGKGAGYGVAVFAAGNIEHIEGFFKTGAYPTGVAFNPVTGQVAAIREKDTSIYHLSEPAKSQKVTGKFAGPCAWSGGGNYLMLANKTKGISVYANPLSAKEKLIARRWPQEIKVAAAPVTPRPKAATVKPVLWLAKFTVRATRLSVKRALARAIKEGRTDQPLTWPNYSAYTKADSQLPAKISKIEEDMNSPDGAGVAIYKLKKELKAQPKSTPVKLSLARALSRSGQTAEARRLFGQVIRSDAGRTNLTRVALTDLGLVWQKQGNELAAIYCLAASAWTDKANPKTMKLLLPLLQKNGFSAEAQQLSTGSAGGTITAARRPPPAGQAPCPLGARKEVQRHGHSRQIRTVDRPDQGGKRDGHRRVRRQGGDHID